MKLTAIRLKDGYGWVCEGVIAHPIKNKKPSAWIGSRPLCRECRKLLIRESA